MHLAPGEIKHLSWMKGSKLGMSEFSHFMIRGVCECRPGGGQPVFSSVSMESHGSTRFSMSRFC